MPYTQMCVIKKSRQIQQQDCLLSNFRDAEYIGNQGGFKRGNLRNGKQHLVSNLGWAYHMNVYTYKLKEHKIFQNKSRKKICLDNSIIENFFSLIKQKNYNGREYHSFEKLK